jgi:hypothetical protein
MKRTTLYTRAEILAAVRQAEDRARQELSIEDFKQSYTRASIPNTNIKPSEQSITLHSGQIKSLTELQTLIQEKIEEGYTDMKFYAGYDDFEDAFVELFFEAHEQEPIEAWEKRLTGVLEYMVKQAGRKVLSEMEGHNHQVKEYLKLKKQFEG